MSNNIRETRDIKPGIGHRIKTARLAAGYVNQSEFARLIRLKGGNGTLWRYETDRSVPSGEVVARIARATNVSSDWIWGETKVRQRTPSTSHKHAHMHMPALRDKDEDNATRDALDYWLNHTTHQNLTPRQIEYIKLLKRARILCETAIQVVYAGVENDEEILAAIEETARIIKQLITKRRKKS